MKSSKERRRWTPERKLRLVVEALQSEGKIAELCRREGLAPNLIYGWRKKLFASAPAVFTPRKEGSVEDRRLEKLQAENLRMKSVIAEITAENLELKKTLSD